MIDDATKKECDAKGRRNILSAIGASLYYSFFACVIIGALAILISQHWSRIYDRDFDAAIWRTQPNERYTMVHDLIDRLEHSNYSRDDLIELMGDTDSQPLSPTMAWNLGECSEIPYRYCYCWLAVDLVNDRIVKVRLHSS